MKFKTRFENLLAKIAGESGAKQVDPKTKEETLLADIGEAMSGRAKFVRLYKKVENETIYLYPDAECKEGYASFQEAISALKDAVVFIYLNGQGSGLDGVYATSFNVIRSPQLGEIGITYMDFYAYPFEYVEGYVVINPSMPQPAGGR